MMEHLFTLAKMVDGMIMLDLWNYICMYACLKTNYVKLYKNI